MQTLETLNAISLDFLSEGYECLTAGVRIDSLFEQPNQAVWILVALGRCLEVLAHTRGATRSEEHERDAHSASWYDRHIALGCAKSTIDPLETDGVFL